MPYRLLEKEYQKISQSDFLMAAHGLMFITMGVYAACNSAVACVWGVPSLISATWRFCFLKNTRSNYKEMRERNFTFANYLPLCKKNYKNVRRYEIAVFVMLLMSTGVKYFFSDTLFFGVSTAVACALYLWELCENKKIQSYLQPIIELLISQYVVPNVVQAVSTVAIGIPLENWEVLQPVVEGEVLAENLFYDTPQLSQNQNVAQGALEMVVVQNPLVVGGVGAGV